LINLNLSQDLVLGGKNGESACVRGNFVGYEVIIQFCLWGNYGGQVLYIHSMHGHFLVEAPIKFNHLIINVGLREG